LGLSPAVLQELLEHTEGEAEKTEKAGSADPISDEPSTQTKWHNIGKIVYEVNTTSGHIEPRLRLWVNSGITSPSESGGSTPEPSGSTSEDRSDSSEKMVVHGIGGTNDISMLWALQRRTRTVPCSGSGNAQFSEVSTSE
jgi:hypothetical protein